MHMCQSEQLCNIGICNNLGLLAWLVVHASCQVNDWRFDLGKPECGAVCLWCCMHMRCVLVVIVAVCDCAVVCMQCWVLVVLRDCVLRVLCLVRSKHFTLVT